MLHRDRLYMGQADRPSLLHHRLALDYDDPTLSCAQCPGEAPRSVLPRTDAISCRCATGYGANLLGKCVPAAGPLQARGNMAAHIGPKVIGWPWGAS